MGHLLLRKLLRLLLFLLPGEKVPIRLSCPVVTAVWRVGTVIRKLATVPANRRLGCVALS